MKVLLENLSKHFGKVIAVHEVNLEVRDGEFVALLGPSGCGKTTTLLMIAGIYQPTAGTIKFGERVVNFLPPKERNIGMVFQSYALYPHMTVFANIAFPMILKKVPQVKMRENVKKVADLLQIGNLLDRHPGQLSGGQQQRVALARALGKEPDLLLFDEPLSNLDAKLRLRMRSEIKRLQMELGITSVYVTHDQVEAMTMADRVAVMHEGRLLAYDTPDTLYNRPSTLFTAGFIGSPPMNFLPMRLERKDGAVCLDTGWLCLPLSAEQGDVVARSHMGANVILGIRPEHLAIVPEGDLKATVYVVEPLGREDLVVLRVDENELRVLMPSPFRGEVGQMVSVRLDRSKLHLFDPQTEQALL
ncbi:MAG: ABC transporter ATP-binding protein [Chloroflexi bacterium]|nr:ABC transporter ATP-binding protein [Chloroflexota bacterium]